MPLFPTSRDELMSRFLDHITSTTNIRQTVVGSKTRAIGEAINREIELLSQLEEANMDKAFLPTTYGQWLDYFATMVGVKRRPPRNAEVLAEDRIIRFYVTGNRTFGSINGNAEFTVPAGTLLTAPVETPLEATASFLYINEGNTTSDRSVHYTTTESVTCSPTATEAFVSAKALTSGVGGNIAAPGMLKMHTYTAYSDYASRSLQVANVRPILDGLEKEQDVSLRYRISKAITTAEKANETAVGQAALSVPGVVDYVILPYEDGIGRFNIYIKSVGPQVTDRMINAVQIKINETQAAGCIGYARRPFEVGLEIDSLFVYRGQVKEEEKALIRENAVFASMTYINSLDVGQPLVLSDLAEAVLSVDGRVSAVGTDKNTLFDHVFVHYPARTQNGGKRRERLMVGSIDVAPNARIIVEPRVSIPVRFV